jgi:hypothetical protein
MKALWRARPVVRPGSDRIAVEAPWPMPIRKGDWICTNSGVHYYPLDPRAHEVRITDIAYALSKLCRYGGHCSDFYSVAEHSVLASYLVPARLALSALLHDAAEAYLVDLPRPIKRHIVLYQQIEHMNEIMVARHFRLRADFASCGAVRAADEMMLTCEMMKLMPHTMWRFSDLGPAPLPIRCWDHNEAALQFMTRYLELTGEKT